jgi:hypothetical protein
VVDSTIVRPIDRYKQNYYFAQDNRLRRACIDYASRFALLLRQTMDHKKLMLLELGNLQAKTPWLPWLFQRSVSLWTLESYSTLASIIKPVQQTIWS